MKKIEETVLVNMELVDRYLSGKMSQEEMDRFHERLQRDLELQEDLEMAKEVLGYGSEPWWAASTKHGNPVMASDPRLARKAAVGKNIISYGLAVVATAAIMAITCALIMFLLQ